MPREIHLEDLTEPELSELMLTMARAIEKVGRDAGLAPRPLFVLLLFNDPAVAQYVSNCNRGDVIAALREGADRMDAGDDVSRD